MPPYDPIQDRMVAWSGGNDVYLLDLDDWTWSHIQPGGATPTAAAPAGTFGRFRYSPKYNVFVVVNSVDENAFILKLTGAPSCVNGETVRCYDGPPASRNVGECKDGISTCSEGQIGVCEEQVIPSVEICNDADDNCNGVIDDGCAIDADSALDPIDLGLDAVADIRIVDLGPDTMSTVDLGQGDIATAVPTESKNGCSSTMSKMTWFPTLTISLLIGIGVAHRKYTL